MVTYLRTFLRATLYYANVLDNQNIRLSTSEANAFNNVFVQIYGGSDMRIESRVNDKNPNDAGHPLQYDEINEQWFVFTQGNSPIYQYIKNNPTSNDGDDFISYFERKSDNRALDDKLYRVRYVIPKEAQNAKPPTPGYVVQASSTTGALTSDDFEKTTLSIDDYEYDRNPRYIVEAKVAGNNREIEVRCEMPHQPIRVVTKSTSSILSQQITPMDLVVEVTMVNLKLLTLMMLETLDIALLT